MLVRLLLKSVTKINVFKNVKVAREGDPKYCANWTIFYFNYPH